jgi:hypothetical protein
MEGPSLEISAACFSPDFFLRAVFDQYGSHTATL